MGDANLVVSGCVEYVDKTVVTEDGETDTDDADTEGAMMTLKALGIKKPRVGVTGSCMFTCADGFRPGLKPAVEEEEDAERAKNGKKKSKRNKGKKSSKGKGKNHKNDITVLAVPVREDHLTVANRETLTIEMTLFRN